MELRIAGAQIPVYDHVNENVAAIERALRFAIKNRADILLTPEGSLSGYHNRFSQPEVERALEEILAIARNGRIGLALGTCFHEADGKCYDQLRFYDKQGRFLGFQSKTLLCGPLDDPDAGESAYFSSSPLRTFLFEGVTIGGLICNDLWANPTCTAGPDPRLSWELSRMGAKVLFHAVSGWRDNTEFCRIYQKNYHESNLILQAAAGKLWIATVDNAAPFHIPVSSPGGIVSPDGKWAEKAPDMGEQFFCRTIKIC